MLNLKRQGCLAALKKSGSGYDLDMFYLYVDSVSLDTASCAQKPNEGIYRSITQTAEGKLSVYYKGKDKSSFETWFAYNRRSSELNKNYGINFYIGLETNYGNRYIFGKFLLKIFRILEDFVRGSYSA
jgi:histidinol phosphatase-like PHP family hydrolase